MICVGVGLLGIAVLRIYPQLPSLDILVNYHPKQPLRIYSADGKLLRLFGEERRTVVPFSEIPNNLRLALLAAEDAHFYQHGGIDVMGLLRATARNLASARFRQGGSTITMQVARNFFLSPQRTIKRKLYEAVLAVKLEHELTKNKILEIYMNQIYLGNRSFGFGAAAETYFGKSLRELSLAEAAMLAGLPQSPSTANPIRNFPRAKQRQAYVLRQMREVGFITDKQLDQSLREPLKIQSLQEASSSFHSEYVAEMVRLTLAGIFPEEILNQGLLVVTTIISRDQAEAYQALRQGLATYDRRHGYRGIERAVELPPDADVDAIANALDDVQDYDGYAAALVLDVTPQSIRVALTSGETETLNDRQTLAYLAPEIQRRLPADRRLRRGAIIRVAQESNGKWYMTQMPEVEGAFISANPDDGKIYALVGGSDFERSKYNRVYQALRQMGSSFKPFIYSAALEKGYMPGTLLPDESIFVSAAENNGKDWEPQNYDGAAEGPLPMRTALKKSRNLATIHLLDAIGTIYARDYASRFGFDKKDIPPYLAMALGAGSATPWDVAGAYAIFANGGYRVKPYLIQAVYNTKGQLLAKTYPLTADDESNRVLEPRNAYLMNSMLQDVVRSGTGASASKLGRSDIAGKTGTTNDYLDAWFAGYQKSRVAVCWIGYDQPRQLGRAETGGAVALPVWIQYMGSVLQGVPNIPVMARPSGIETMTTLLPGGSKSDDLAYQEYVAGGPTFYDDSEIAQQKSTTVPPSATTDTEAPAVTTDTSSPATAPPSAPQPTTTPAGLPH